MFYIIASKAEKWPGDSSIDSTAGGNLSSGWCQNTMPKSQNLYSKED
jgi:hypothetical protein